MEEGGSSGSGSLGSSETAINMNDNSGSGDREAAPRIRIFRTVTATVFVSQISTLRRPTGRTGLSTTTPATTVSAKQNFRTPSVLSCSAARYYGAESEGHPPTADKTNGHVGSRSAEGTSPGSPKVRSSASDQPYPKNQEQVERTFALLMMEGRVRSAVRLLTDRLGGGVLDPGANAEGAGGTPMRTVFDILQEKDPPQKEADPRAFPQCDELTAP